MDSGDLLRSWLAVSGLSQADLSDKTGVGQSAVSMWVSGKRTPSVQSIMRIAQALGVSLDEYLKGPSEQESTTMYRESGMRDEMLKILAGLTGEELRDAYKFFKKMYGTSEQKKSAS